MVVRSRSQQPGHLMKFNRFYFQSFSIKTRSGTQLFWTVLNLYPMQTLIGLIGFTEMILLNRFLIIRVITRNLGRTKVLVHF